MIKNLLKISLLLFFIVISTQVFAQSLQGKVADSTGVAIPEPAYKLLVRKLELQQMAMANIH